MDSMESMESILPLQREVKENQVIFEGQIGDNCKNFVSSLYQGTWMFGGDRYYFPRRHWMDNGNEIPSGVEYYNTSKEARLIASINEDPRDEIMRNLKTIAIKANIKDKFDKVIRETEDAASFVTRRKKVGKKIDKIISKSENKKNDYDSFLATRENFIKDAVTLNCFTLIAQENLPHNSEKFSYMKDRFYVWECGYSVVGNKYHLCGSKSLI